MDHALLQGWGMDVNFNSLNEPLGREVQEELDRFTGQPEDGAKKKRARVAPKLLQGVQKRAAGNAMCLPDIGLLQLCSLLSVENSQLWECGPCEEEIQLTTGGDVGIIVINPDDDIERGRLHLADQFLHDDMFQDGLGSDVADESD